jgi:hypothetical protein
MQITVIDVSQQTHASKNGRTYQSLEVAYKNDQGQTQSKKLVSFTNPEVFKAAKDWQKGATVEVTTVKDAAGYWQWTGLGENAQVATETKQATPTSTRVTGSNYETKEERAQRQVYIIRQSSLSSAVELLKGSTNKAQDIISLAKEFEAYVFEQTSGVDAINAIEDDIPA